MGDSPVTKERPGTLFTVWVSGAMAGLSLLLTTAVAAGDGMNATGYRVDDLPGLQGDPGFAQYAGYLDVAPQRGGRMFFWMTEADVQTEDTPVVIWLDGGPGDSSLNALFWENGPLRVDLAGTVTLADARWNRHADMVYVDQPLGTGFSVVDTAGAVTTREQVVEDFLAFLDAFYAVFPDKRERPLYLSGESFAGHYIPDFARAIIDRNARGEAPAALRLEGLLIISAMVDPLIQFHADIDYAQGAGLIDARQRTVVEDQFTIFKAAIDDGTADQDSFNAMLGSILQYTGSTTVGVNMYDISRYDVAAGFLWPAEEMGAMTAYLNREDVRQAIHVGDFSGEFGGFSETVFEDLMPYFYVSTAPVLAGLLEELPVLMAAGQWDMMSNHIGQERLLAALDWTGREGFAQVERGVWMLADQPVGYGRAYGNLTYLMVIGGSHMLPFTQPDASEDMLRRFLAGEGFDDFMLE